MGFVIIDVYLSSADIFRMLTFFLRAWLAYSADFIPSSSKTCVWYRTELTLHAGFSDLEGIIYTNKIPILFRTCIKSTLHPKRPYTSGPYKWAWVYFTEVKCNSDFLSFCITFQPLVPPLNDIFIKNIISYGTSHYAILYFIDPTFLHFPHPVFQGWAYGRARLPPAG